MKEISLFELMVIEESVDNGGGFGCFSNNFANSIGVICGWYCYGGICFPW